MFQKILLGSLLAVLLLSIPLVSCVAPDGSSSGGTTTTPIQELSNRVLAVEQNYVKRDEFNAFGTRLVAVEGRPSGSADAYSKSDTYTKTEVDSKITTLNTTITNYETRIKALEDKVGGTSTSSGSSTGTVIYTTSPVSIPQIFSSATGTSSNPWIMTISNQTNSWQYVKPVLNLNVASGQPTSLVTALTVMTSCGLCNLTGAFNAGTTTGNFSLSPNNMNTAQTGSIVIIPITGCNGSGELQIGPGQSQALNVQIQGLTTPNPILWNVTCSISSRGM